MREGDLRIGAVLDAVAEHFKITRDELVSGRPRPRARQLAKYLACRVTRLSFRQIGARFGGISGTNVVHSLRKIERDMETDAALRAEVETLRFAPSAGKAELRRSRRCRRLPEFDRDARDQSYFLCGLPLVAFSSSSSSL